MTARRPSPTRSSARLSLESLERRDLKAGNVMVSLSNGTLNVVGDGAGNGVAIAQVGPTSYRVTGINHLGTTLINGRFNWVQVNNVWNDVAVNLGNGNDYLAIRGTTSGGWATLADDLFITMGNGNDQVDLGQLSNRDGDDRMFVDTGAGADIVRISQVVCRDRLEVTTGSGNDSLEVSNSRVGRMFADLGADNDTIRVVSNWFGSQPTVDGGTGFDRGTFRGNSVGVAVRSFESLS